MASLNKLLDSLVQQAKGGQGDAKGASTVLPHWIFEGAAIAYRSERSEQTLDVIVESVDQAKQQVKFVFERDRKVWKSVTFAQIVAGSNPLRQRAGTSGQRPGAGGGTAKAKAADEDDDLDLDAFADGLEGKWDATKKREHRSGPAANKLPKRWRMPEVVSIIEAPGTVDIDSSPEREAPPPLSAAEERDPYGLAGLGLEALLPPAPGGAAAGEASAGGSPRPRGGRRRSGSPEARKERRRARSEAPERPSSRSRSRGGRNRSPVRQRRRRSGSGSGGSEDRQRKRRRR